MEKFLLLIMMAAAVAAQVRVDVTPTDGVGVSVGRGRGIVEDTSRLPGKHNLVTVTARRPKATCTDAFSTLALRNKYSTDSRDWDNYNQQYQKLVATDACGEETYRSESHNLVVNAGLNWLADIMGNTSTPAVNTQCNYIALTNTAITPGATDTTLTGEIASNGLTRAQGTYTHSANATTFTIAKTFTASGAQSAQAGAVFTAVSTGTMCYEDTFTVAALQINDTLTVTWTITI